MTHLIHETRIINPHLLDVENGAGFDDYTLRSSIFMEFLCIGYVRGYFHANNICSYTNDIASIIHSHLSNYSYQIHFSYNNIGPSTLETLTRRPKCLLLFENAFSKDYNIDLQSALPPNIRIKFCRFKLQQMW